MKQIDRKREQILEAARHIFSRYGYNKTTLEDIGEAVGMKKNSLYHYFQNKEDLFQQLIKQESDYYFETVNELIKKQKTIAKKIITLILGGIKSDEDRSNFYNSTIAAKIENNEIVDEFYNELRIQLVDLVKNLLIAGVKSKEFIPHDSELLADDLVELVVALEKRITEKSKAVFVKEIDFGKLRERLMNILTLILKGIERVK